MSNFSKVYDFLLHNQKSHAHIAEFYRSLSLDASNERVKLLLNILVKHELELLRFVDSYIESSPAEVRETFIQFDREQSVEHLFSPDFERSQINSADVENIAQRFDEYFCKLYEGLSGADESSNVQELFENLRQHMSQEKKRLSMDISSMEDI
jgi:hypothetical protein